MPAAAEQRRAGTLAPGAASAAGAARARPRGCSGTSPAVPRPERACPYRHHGVGEHQQHLVAIGAHVAAGALPAPAAAGASGGSGRGGRPPHGAAPVPDPDPRRLQLPQRRAELPPLRQQEQRARRAERRQQPHGGQQRPPALRLHRRQQRAPPRLYPGRAGQGRAQHHMALQGTAPRPE